MVGTAKMVESYVQEIGCSGRNGEQAVALCIATPTNVHTNKDMREYLKNKDKCRRTILFETALETHTNRPLSMCKYVCALQCECG